jgi:hypothetical protein
MPLCWVGTGSSGSPTLQVAQAHSLNPLTLFALLLLLLLLLCPRWVHIDVMDGRFVPNITIGPLVVDALRPVTDKVLDCHLVSDCVWNFLQTTLSGVVKRPPSAASFSGQRSCSLHRLCVRRLGAYAAAPSSTCSCAPHKPPLSEMFLQHVCPHG